MSNEQRTKCEQAEKFNASQQANASEQANASNASERSKEGRCGSRAGRGPGRGVAGWQPREQQSPEGARASERGPGSVSRSETASRSEVTPQGDFFAHAKNLRQQVDHNVVQSSEAGAAV
jgi:hypothetical protein